MEPAKLNRTINKKADFKFDFFVLGDDRARTAKLVLTGLAADRPSASTKDRLYVATDTNVVSYDTGAAWVTMTPIDLTGATIVSKVKAKITDSAALVNFTTTVVDGPHGLARLSLSAAQTTTLNFTTGVYDVFITLSSGETFKYLEGNVTLDKNVS